MKTKNKKNEILFPKNQLQLYGYDDYFNTFIKLFNNNKLPNTILLSGPKGSGKATFAYHFINYLLSRQENSNYSINKFTINPENKSYKNLCSNTHPNFYPLENILNEENVKIENVKRILKFLNKSTYNSNIKIVMIDNAEYLNISSANALLKALEEPSDNTFFFIIHNNSSTISATIKSRCVEFKIFHSLLEKKLILDKIVKQYEYDINIDELDSNIYIESPGNIFKYLSIFNEINLIDPKNIIISISYLIDQFKQKKDPQLLNFISLFVEIFYKNLSLKNYKKLNIYFYNKHKILKLINDVKKFNLDKNNFFISLKGILQNDS